jgi:hypothetical protein
MTLGCGSPGGNITSDNISPLHLLNVKRIAWESRGVEHRTVPADQRMAGATIPGEAVAVQEKVPTPAIAALAPSVTATAADAPGISATAAAPPKSKPNAKTEERKPAATVASPATANFERAAIARVVERVLAAQGIARGSGAPKSNPAPELAAPAPSASKKELPSPSAIATEIASRLFGAAAKKSDRGKATPTPPPSIPSASPATAGVNKGKEPPAKVAAEIQSFVSETDVRRAMTRSEKIFIGRKTILTPSARDLGLEHEVFVETEAGSIR